MRTTGELKMQRTRPDGWPGDVVTGCSPTGSLRKDHSVSQRIDRQDALEDRHPSGMCDTAICP